MHIHELKSNMDTKPKASQAEKERTKRSRCIGCCIMMKHPSPCIRTSQSQYEKSNIICNCHNERDIRLLFYGICPNSQLGPPTVPCNQAGFFFFFQLNPHTKNKNKNNKKNKKKNPKPNLQKHTHILKSQSNLAFRFVFFFNDLMF